MRLPELIADDDLDFALHDAVEAGSPDAIIDWIQTAIDDPARRGEEFSIARAMTVISELQQRFDRVDEAEATLRVAVAADLHDSAVHPSAWLAQLLADTGRLREAAETFADLRRRGHAGILEHEIYGEALEAAGDQDGALKVFAAGELLAERSGNDFMQARMSMAVQRVRAGGFMNLPHVKVPALATRASRDSAEDRHRYDVVASVLFWPRTDHERAIAAWPELTAQLGTDWGIHRARTERALGMSTEEYDEAAFTRANYDEFAAYVASHGPNSPTSATLDAYAKASKHAMARTPWPPERNAPCWCGSGQKYKRCCRPCGFVA